MLQFSRPITKFTEEFDFMAMNEKFKKEEVWGHLGKSSKAQSGDGEENDGDYSNDEDDLGSSKVEVEEKVRLYPPKNIKENKRSNLTQSKDCDSFLLFFFQPVYVKDDFFDSLSCNALDHGSRNGRTKFSEQIKIDTEVMLSYFYF